MGRRRRLVLLLAVGGALAVASPAAAAEVSQSERFTTSDGVSLQTTLSGEGPLAPRPVVVEFSPYGRDSGTLDPGPAYNSLLVQIRGTGDSDGSFDALGPRTQSDVAEVLDWACHQPWSDGRLAINGFSASAITIYNSLHLPLPCVKAAVLKSGTFELYRDLIYPGGVSNLVPAAGVMALIGAPALSQGGDRVRDPATGLQILLGLLAAGADGLTHQTLDSWWQERGFRGDVNHLPILMIDGFFDVESRGAFQAYQQLRGDGAHLLVVGAHDGAPLGTDGGLGAARDWLDHFVRGVPNGAEAEPRVKLWMASGDREDELGGDFVRYDGADWPIPGTRWESLALDPARSGSADSINDGSLTPGAAPQSADQSYPTSSSLPSASDPPNTAIVGAAGFNRLLTAVPGLSEMAATEPHSLTYTTPPLASEVLSAGPASLELRLSSTAPETAIWALIADVAPDGSAHPLTVGRLLNSFPEIDEGRSLADPAGGGYVQPYGVYSEKDPAAVGASRLYRVEFWPIGNRFEAGHRLRLYVLGASGASAPGVPGVNTVAAGGPQGSRLLVPVLPGGSVSFSPSQTTPSSAGSPSSAESRPHLTIRTCPPSALPWKCRCRSRPRCKRKRHKKEHRAQRAGAAASATSPTATSSTRSSRSATATSRRSGTARTTSG